MIYALKNTTGLEIWQDELKWVLNIDRLMKYMKMPQNSHSTEQQLEQPRSTLLSFFISPKQTPHHNYVTHYEHVYSLCKRYNFLHSSTDSNAKRLLAQPQTVKQVSILNSVLSIIIAYVIASSTSRQGRIVQTEV